MRKMSLTESKLKTRTNVLEHQKTIKRILKIMQSQALLIQLKMKHAEYAK